MIIWRISRWLFVLFETHYSAGTTFVHMCVFVWECVCMCVCVCAYVCVCVCARARMRARGSLHCLPCSERNARTFPTQSSRHPVPPVAPGRLGADLSKSWSLQLPPQKEKFIVVNSARKTASLNQVKKTIWARPASSAFCVDRLRIQHYLNASSHMDRPVEGTSKKKDTN